MVIYYLTAILNGLKLSRSVSLAQKIDPKDNNISNELYKFGYLIMMVAHGFNRVLNEVSIKQGKNLDLYKTMYDSKDEYQYRFLTSDEIVIAPSCAIALLLTEIPACAIDWIKDDKLLLTHIMSTFDNVYFSAVHDVAKKSLASAISNHKSHTKNKNETPQTIDRKKTELSNDSHQEPSNCTANVDFINEQMSIALSKEAEHSDHEPIYDHEYYVEHQSNEQDSEPLHSINSSPQQVKDPLLERFVFWLKNGIQDGSLSINEDSSIVFRVNTGMFLVFPQAFTLFNRQSKAEVEKHNDFPSLSVGQIILNTLTDQDMMMTKQEIVSRYQINAKERTGVLINSSFNYIINDFPILTSKKLTGIHKGRESTTPP